MNEKIKKHYERKAVLSLTEGMSFHFTLDLIIMNLEKMVFYIAPRMIRI